MVDTLEGVTEQLGTPKTIQVDQGPELVSKALDLWAWLNGVTLDFSRPGTLTLYGKISSTPHRSCTIGAIQLASHILYTVELNSHNEQRRT